MEIDWIWLTGVGEQLSGETGPPGSDSPVSFGEQFSDPAFTAIVDGIGSPKWVPMAFLRDVDGDGDLDVVSMWSTNGWDRLGWVVAANDGTGSFAPGRVTEGAAPFFLGAGDLDGDGLVDLVLNSGSDNLRVLHNAADEGFVLSQESRTPSSPRSLAGVWCDPLPSLCGRRELRTRPLPGGPPCQQQGR